MRLARIVPVLSLVLLHGLAVGREGIAIAAVAITTAGALAGWRPTFGRRGEILLALAGAAMGGAALALSATPPGPLPPVVLSPLCGALTALACAWTLSEKLTASWTAAVLLVVAATSAPPVRPLLVPGVVVLSVVLLSAAVLAHGRALDRVRVAAAAAYLGVVGLGTAGLSWTMTASEGVLLPLFEAMLDAGGFGSGLGLEAMVPLVPYSTAALSDRVLVEIDGEVPPYFRGQVMDVFDGDVWSASEAIRSPAPAAPDGLGSETATLTLFTGIKDHLPVPAGTLARDGAADFTAGWLVAGGALRGDTVVLARQESAVLPVEPAPEPGLRALPEDLADALRPLAREIVGDAQTAGAKAAAIEAHLSTRHTYALTSDLRGDGHPLVVLITEQRPAYCVYFASAMAAMLRSLSVDARMVGGFVAVERNPLTGRTLLRKRDAHAWVEAWLPETRRWTAFDPTPSREAVLDIPQPGVIRAVQDFLIRLAVRARTHPDAVLRELLLSPPVVALLVVGGAWSLRQRLRGSSWRTPRGGRGPTDPALWPLYRRYLKALKRWGITPGAAESDGEVLARVREAAPEKAAGVEGFLEAYREARYGDGEVAAVEERLRAVETDP